MAIKDFLTGFRSRHKSTMTPIRMNQTITPPIKPIKPNFTKPQRMQHAQGDVLSGYRKAMQNNTLGRGFGPKRRKG